MSRPDYTDFDAQLLNLIKVGRNTFTQLEGHKPLIEMAKPFCIAVRSRYAPEPFRIIDRRLQALRKAGKIEYGSGKWRVIDAQEGADHE